MLSYCAMTWRPGWNERHVLCVFEALSELLLTVFSGAVAQSLLIASFMMHSTDESNLIIFTAVPTVCVVLHQNVNDKSMTKLDLFSTGVVLSGLLILCIGEELADNGSMMNRHLSMTFAFFGALLLSVFLHKARRLSRSLSNVFIVTVTDVLSCACAGVIAAFIGGFGAKIGPTGDRVSTIANLSRKEFLHLSLCSLFTFLWLFFHHTAYAYFDNVSVAGGISFCVPLSLLVYRLYGLSSVDVAYDVSGGVIAAVGCVLITYSGILHRKSIAMKISLPS
jgi:hypothetical protein